MKEKFLTFFKLFIHRMNENKVSVFAGYLTYTTLLSIVPTIMVVLSVFSFFPMFDEAAAQIISFTYDNFAPHAGDVVQRYLDMFVENSRKMGLVSILGLIVVAVMLISSIDNALNQIWHTSQKRPLIPSFLIYLAVLILGPIFAGLSIAISSYLFSLRIFEDRGVLSLHYILEFVPFIITWLMFSLIYLVVPNTHVRFKHAAIGALLAGVFFTLGKQVFIWYITTFPSYQAIYGALAIIPIMFVWIQLSWQVVLLGAQFASTLKDLEMIEQGTLTNPLSETHSSLEQQ
ncbi:tRNA-processing RNAse BN [Nicoletella semolina]|uniref:UPF0761 membrane protein EV693_11040 n=1 Tax=Nicoletella semolina TaxID=271160 RepID=A0A4R2N6V4_9PAST|nr:virulence factor BrkB family protein [Nicoletella semolina]MDH2924716.1 hypothetical protein [Nicoletella semolina]TCP16660.1 tRNA-processing RNAse BN [Nicoletella semolina]